MEFLPPSVSFGFCTEGQDNQIPQKDAWTDSEEHNYNHERSCWDWNHWSFPQHQHAVVSNAFIISNEIKSPLFGFIFIAANRAELVTLLFGGELVGASVLADWRSAASPGGPSVTKTARRRQQLWSLANQLSSSSRSSDQLSPAISSEGGEPEWIRSRTLHQSWWIMHLIWWKSCCPTPFLCFICTKTNDLWWKWEREWDWQNWNVNYVWYL